MQWSRRDIWGVSLILTVLLGLAVSAQFMASWEPTSTDWLPRLGCIMVAAGALLGADVQIRYRSLRRQPTRTADGYVAWVERLELFSLFVLVVLGTLLWGFGDLMHDTDVAD